MQTIRDLRKRIRSVENIKRITSAMEKIAAARLFKAKKSLMSSRPYATALTGIVNDLLSSQPEAVHPLLERNEQGDVLIILVTSDRGLCGGYNTAILEKAMEFLEKVGRGKVKFVVFGRKGADFLRKQNHEILASYINLPAFLPYGYAEEVGSKAIDLYAGQEVSEVFLIVTEFVSVGRHTPRARKILPVERSPEAGRNYMNYSYEPFSPEIIDTILPRLVKTEIWSGLLESAVSEHAARMFMMQRATKNTDDMIGDLTLVMNKARQAGITRELTDIVGAAETIA